jgi:hypothetical protein
MAAAVDGPAGADALVLDGCWLQPTSAAAPVNKAAFSATLSKRLVITGFSLSMDGCSNNAAEGPNGQARPIMRRASGVSS